MRCPFCAHEDSQVKDSRPSEDGAAIRRRRQCEGCGARFTTFERVHLKDLVVVKKDGKREPFDRAKLERAIGHSCRKRDIDPAKIDQLISGVQRQLETRGDEVTTAAIGEEIGQAIGDSASGLAVWAAIHGLAMLILENVIDLGQTQAGMDVVPSRAEIILRSLTEALSP